MNLGEMRSYIQSVVEIDNSDISDDVMNRMLGQGLSLIHISEPTRPY